MKSFLFVTLTLISLSARADDEHVLLVRSVSSTSSSVTTTCEVFENKVTITRAFGPLAQPNFTTKEIKTQSVSPGFLETIKTANLEVPTFAHSRCGSGNEYIAAWMKNTTGAYERVVLTFVGSCAEDEIERSGSASNQLRMMARYTCGF